MELSLLLTLLILLVLIIQFIVIIILIGKNRQSSQDDVLKKLIEFNTRLGENELKIRNELGNQFGQNRGDLTLSLKSVSEQLSTTITNFTGLVDNKIKSILDSLSVSSKTNRDELAKSIIDFEKQVTNGLEKNREIIERKLAEIQAGNEIKLEKMRETVDEKLHKTLETRLGESFKLVSERLEQVQKGLGEMQNLANGVGDLKKVLSNVKTKGVLGEYQLGAILEQLLAPHQYSQNVATKEGSRENVEFAIKIPNKNDSDKTVWLPIDSKFPTVDYESVMDAYDSGDLNILERSKKELETKIKNFAKDIHTKYVDPPNTTEFAIMFLPFEGLYAEVLRIPSLFETIQNTYKVTIAGPTTISAFLNSLQMGFRSLAVEKRTNEIWNVLAAVRTEFGKFGDILDATKKKLDQASAELEKTGTRTRQIEKKLQGFDALPETEAQKILMET
jgi:DNA recombination protein RmuC